MKDEMFVRTIAADIFLSDSENNSDDEEILGVYNKLMVEQLQNSSDFR